MKNVFMVAVLILSGTVLLSAKAEDGLVEKIKVPQNISDKKVVIRTSEDKNNDLDAEKLAQIKLDIKSARKISRVGKNLFLSGIEMQVFSFSLLLSMIFSNDNVSFETLLAFVSLGIAGETMSLAGQIIACVGGTKAKHALNELGDSPNFNGWKYFGIGMGIKVGSAVVYESEKILLPLFIYGGILGFNIASVVSSSRYTKSAIHKISGLPDVTISPVFNGKQFGFILTADY